MSTPSSATNCSATRRPIPGMPIPDADCSSQVSGASDLAASDCVAECREQDRLFVRFPRRWLRRLGRLGMNVSSNLLVIVSQLLIQKVDMQQMLGDQEAVMVTHPSDERLLQLARLLRMRPRANSASAVTSLWPSTIASSIARAETPATSVATDASLRLAHSSTFCRPLTTSARSRTKIVRWRVRSRRSRWGSGGMKLARANHGQASRRSTQRPSRQSCGPGHCACGGH